MTAPARHTAPWTVLLAFALVYVSWGTTYLAIRVGVHEFPPCLFGGVRVALAGSILLLFLRLRGVSLRLPLRDLLFAGLVGIILFVAGNGLISVAEKTVPSGITSVLVTTTPLCMALLEVLAPRGERLGWIGWLGLFTGLGGVLLLLTPQIEEPGALLKDFGPLLVLASAFAWSVGSFLVRYGNRKTAHLTGAAYQMLLGGLGLALVGLVCGEWQELQLAHCSFSGIYAFFHLLIFGSLVGFVAYNWLLGQVSAAKAGTYAYVNPVIAVVVGWLLGGESITPWVLAGMAVILIGVALVKTGGHIVKDSPAKPVITTNGEEGLMAAEYLVSPAAGSE